MLPGIDVVGHRIVHGGPKYRESVLLTPEVRAAIAEEAEFAPAHNRCSLRPSRPWTASSEPRCLQVAVFDTGFHATLAPAAYVYPGPYAWLERGIRRYGFHGISHQYASRRAAELLQAAELVAAHRLPSGQRSVACRGSRRQKHRHHHGVHAARRPHDGHALGLRRSRHSDLFDPPAGYTADQLDDILNRQSGLLGVSGISGDMREILEAIDKGNERARLAFDIYAHRLMREIGAMLAVSGRRGRARVHRRRRRKLRSAARKTSARSSGFLV